MRCLTLADILKERGVDSWFISHDRPGNLLSSIKDRGHRVYVLADDSCSSQFEPDGKPTAHAHWLGCAWQDDLRQTKSAIEVLMPDWLIVDHYALDLRWEQPLRGYCSKLMVIDDLADRPHSADLLVDQTFGRAPEDYRQWVPRDCEVLTGAKYALLRPEFIKLRQYSLLRREKGRLKHLLIAMGGIDKDNITGEVLDTLNQCSILPENCRITVIMGANSPWTSSVLQQAAVLPWSIDVKVNVPDIASIMADCDFSIGAAGATSWERCCLGLPTIMIVVAENQRTLAQSLEKAGAALVIHEAKRIRTLLPSLLARLLGDLSLMYEMGRSAADITDGNGTQAIVKAMGY
jgi:UDP-2,4-diacetamido-2,4,6-trideoxy-beta-L-altropyranose hydrolase